MDKQIIKKIKTENCGCTTCSEWKNEDPQEFPCFLAKVVIVRTKPRESCKFWRAAT